MADAKRYDAVVVGAGPNGLAAAIALARAGKSVLVIEAHDEPGGGTRTAELTLPGFHHDVCAAILPMAVASPFFRSLPLEAYGVEWVDPPAALAHPLADGTATLVTRSLADTAAALGDDAAAYHRMFGPLIRRWDDLAPMLLGPLRFPPHPFLLARFGLPALLPAAALARLAFRTPRARALFAGMAAHAILPLSMPVSAAFGLVLNSLAHVVGWPVARGGTQRLTDALVAYLTELGGRIETGRRVDSLDDLPPAQAVLLDLSPKEALRIAGDRFPAGYTGQLKHYRHGPGVFKVDYALSGPIPWRAAACASAATVHVGGTLEEIAESEAAAWNGRRTERPFVLVAQQSLFDSTRAPEGCHTAWAYCHVPNGSTEDATQAIEAQIERFAPGFGECVMARHTRTAAGYEVYNPNFVGGDINAGAQFLGQQFTRPAIRAVPYATPVKGVYLCSASTPPGGGVHGMAGYHAARVALRDTLN